MPSTHQPPPQALTRLDRDDLVADVRETVSQFLEPWVSTAPVYAWDEHRRRWSPSPVRDHRTEQRPLLEELLDATPGARASNAPSSSESRMLINAAALDAVTMIQGQLADFATQELGGSHGIRADLVEAARRAPVLPDEPLLALAHMLETWWTAARIVTGQVDEAKTPTMMCPDCERWRAIHVRFDLNLAWCAGPDCNATWRGRQIDGLGKWWAEEGPALIAQRRERLGDEAEAARHAEALRGLVSDPEIVDLSQVRLVHDEDGFPVGAVVLKASDEGAARSAAELVLRRQWAPVLEEPFVDLLLDAVRKCRATEQVGRFVRSGDGVKWRPLPAEAAGGRHVISAWRLSWKRRPWWQPSEVQVEAVDA